MRIKDGIEGAGDRLDRWQHAGIANMREYKEFRHQTAMDHEMRELEESEEGSDSEEIKGEL